MYVVAGRPAKRQNMWWWDTTAGEKSKSADWAGQLTKETDAPWRAPDKESSMTDGERQSEKRGKTTGCVRETTKNNRAVNGCM